jgi:hypothetical protein
MKTAHVAPITGRVGCASDVVEPVDQACAPPCVRVSKTTAAAVILHHLPSSEPDGIRAASSMGSEQQAGRDLGSKSWDPSSKPDGIWAASHGIRAASRTGSGQQVMGSEQQAGWDPLVHTPRRRADKRSPGTSLSRCASSAGHVTTPPAAPSPRALGAEQACPAPRSPERSAWPALDLPALDPPAAAAAAAAADFALRTLDS